MLTHIANISQFYLTFILLYSHKRSRRFGLFRRRLFALFIILTIAVAVFFAVFFTVFFAFFFAFFIIVSVIVQRHWLLFPRTPATTLEGRRCSGFSSG